MKSVKAFNGLAGTVATRSSLQRIIDLAKDEEQDHIVQKLLTVLDQHPDKRFEIEICEKAIEVAPQSLLDYLSYEQDQDDSAGLARPVPASDIYQMILDKIIKMVKRESAKDYKTKWVKKGYMIPFNFDSKKRYRGINNLMLTEGDLMDNPFFMTFKQVQQHKGKVKAGAHGHEVIYYTKLYTVHDRNSGKKLTSYDYAKVQDFKNKHNIADDISHFPMLKYYKVFNGSDIEGIDFDLENFKIGFTQNDVVASEKNRMPIAEAIFSNYPARKPKLQHGGNRAFYNSGQDLIQMPELTDFATAQDYYRTLFHEASHSTGHASRLSRKLGNRFGSKEYAFEELIAELGATFLSAEAGIRWHSNKNHAAYIKSWNSVLTFADDEAKFILKAAAEAQKAADLILQFDENDDPLYLKSLAQPDNNSAQKKPKPKKKVPDVSPKQSISAKAKPQPIITIDTFKEMARESKTLIDFLKKVRKIKTVPREVSEQFRKKYGKNGASPEAAAEALYKQEQMKMRFSEAGKAPRKQKPKGGQYELALKKPAAKSGTKSGLKQPSPVATDPQQPDPTVASRREKDFPEVQSKPSVVAKVTPGSLAERMSRPKSQHEYYKNVSPDIAKFLGQVEKKKKESVVITLAGGQGSMKTRMLFRLMNDFAQNYKCGHASIEEHPESSLYLDKVKQYLNDTAINNILAPEIESIEALDALIRSVDVVLIDSFKKLKKMRGNFDLDEDLRKKYDGKLFIVIYQLTVAGTMKGGSDSQFDGDIILFTEKKPNYRDNYVWPDKNRYNSIPTDDLKFNIYTGKMLPTVADQQAITAAAVQPLKLSFKVTEH